ELFVSAFVLGLLFNAMPGAIFTESVRRGMRGGFRAALAVQIGSLAGDLLWAVLGLTGAGVLFALPYVTTPLALLGAVLLAWIAVQALQDALSPMPAFDPERALEKSHSALATGAALSLSNPMNVTYWTGLGGTVTALGVANPGWEAFGVFLAGFMTSSVVWCFFCAALIAGARRFISPLTWKVINLGCAAGLAYFAALIAWRTLSPVGT